MKKLLTSTTAALMLASVADARIDFYQGIDSASTTFKTSSAYNKDQTGIGFGGRLYVDLIDELDIGIEAGFSHIETDSNSTGNISHAAFLLKYHFTDWFETFLSLGVGTRFAPETNSSFTNDDSVLTGGMWSIGLAFESDDGWRADMSYTSYSFTGQIEDTTQSISTSLLGFHLGKAFDFK